MTPAETRRAMFASIEATMRLPSGTIIGRRRHRAATRARAIAAHRLRAQGLSYPAIGRAIGGRDHSTIIYFVRRANEWAADPLFAAMLDHPLPPAPAPEPQPVREPKPKAKPDWDEMEFAQRQEMMRAGSDALLAAMLRQGVPA